MTRKIRKEKGEVMAEAMNGVQKEVVDGKTVYKYEPPETEFLKARMKELQAENKRLRDEIATTDEYVAHKEWVQQGMSNEFMELMDEKTKEIAELKAEIAMLKEKIVRLA